MKIAISGSRTFTDRQLVAGVVDELVNRGHTILVGDAPEGVDVFVREYAESYETELELEPGSLHKIFRADWTQYGKAAGAIRNTAMLAEADGFIAIFTPGRRTPGTQNALTAAERLGLPRRVYHYAQWTKYPGNAERTPPVREGSPSAPPDYWSCTACGKESPNPPHPEDILIDVRFGKKSCSDCKKRTVWRLIEVTRPDAT